MASLDLTPLCLENPLGGDSVTFRSVVKTPAANCTKGNGQEGFLGGKTAILIEKQTQSCSLCAQEENCFVLLATAPCLRSEGWVSRCWGVLAAELCRLSPPTQASPVQTQFNFGEVCKGLE